MKFTNPEQVNFFFLREYAGGLRIISLRRIFFFKVYNAGQKGAHAHLNRN